MSEAPLDKKGLEHLAKLARLELDEAEEGKPLSDLQKIVSYVAELQEADTEGILPMNGGTELVNSFRADDERENTNQGSGTESFPETKDGYLQVPAVFE